MTHLTASSFSIHYKTNQHI